uniref:DNA-directed RNA polymerase subunit beta n=1 Tax=Nephromyces sp. ex Molgula occidentalis TaxID=2544991 RepID=A0A5C1H883_9APIC|nr:plastid-encoded DNA-directed RNA polymerase beta [Nephromyces sp. ex Molgula occidentalis]
MLYSQLPFSLKNTETRASKYLIFLKQLLRTKLIQLLPNKLHINHYKSILILHRKNLYLTTQKPLFNWNPYNTNYNPFYQVNLPITIITPIKIINYNLILFQFPKIDLNGNIIINGLKKTYISRFKRTDGFYFTTITIRGQIIYRIFLIFNYHFITIDFNSMTYKLQIWNGQNKIVVDFICFLHFWGCTNKDIISYSRYGNSFILSQILKQTYSNYDSIWSHSTSYCNNLISLTNIFSLNSNWNYLYKLKHPITPIFKDKLNNLFGSDIRNQLIFLSKDLINLLDLLFDFKFTPKSFPLNNNFGNQKLESIIDIIINQIPIIINKRLQNFINYIKINHSISLFNTTKFIPNFKELFMINPLIQYLDQINTLSEIMHKMKLTKINLKPTKDITLRDIKRSELGKLCLIDTNEGFNSGLIVYLPQNILQNKFGSLETPIKKLKSEDKNNFSDTLHSLNQEKTAIQLTKISTRKNLIFNNLNSVTIFKNLLDLKSNKNWLNSFLPQTSFFSLAENFIPFFFYNDPTRSLMGSKMQMQAVPLIYKQNANIITGNEQILSRKNSNLIYALQEGIVTYISSYKIIIRDLYNREVSYYLNTYKFSNQNTFQHNFPLVWVGERVTWGQLLAVNQDFIGSEFSIGNNLFVLYGSFLGYDFEDALIVNKTLINNNLFSSLHMDIYEIPFELSTNKCLEFTSNKIPKYSSYVKRNLNSFGFIKEGSKVIENDLLWAKCTFNKLKYTKESLQYFLFILFGSRLRNIKDTSLSIALGHSGRVVKIEMIIDKKLLNQTQYLKLRFFIIKQRLLEIGDKLWGRYGNKGVLAHIAHSADLPYTENGLYPDIITSSIGVPSRMNIGQLFETLIGLNCFYTNTRFWINNNLNSYFGANYLKILLYNYLKQGALLTGYNFNSYSTGKISFRDGRTGFPIKGACLFGCSLYMKLIHMIKDKIHYRTIGPYSSVIQQPIKGRSKKGGQRFGEMEVWALEAFGAAYNLKELLSIKSDDIQGRFNLQEYLLYNYNLTKSSIPEAFHLLMTELKGLALNIEAMTYSDENDQLRSIHTSFLPSK